MFLSEKPKKVVDSRRRRFTTSLRTISAKKSSRSLANATGPSISANLTICGQSDLSAKARDATSAAPEGGAARTFLERGAGRFAYSSTCQASARFLTLRRFMVFGALHAEVAVAVADVDLEATR